MRHGTRLLATLTVVLLLAAACSGDSSDGSSEAGGGSVGDVDVSLIADAADEIAAASSSRFSYTMSYSGVPELEGGEISGEGEVDNETGAARVRLDMGGLVEQLGGSGELPPGFDGTFETITIGTEVYISAALFGPIAGIDAEWVVIDLEDQLGGLGDIGQGQGLDPEAQLAQLKGIADIEEVGSEEVRGVETTHYTGAINMADALAELDDEQRQALAGLYGGDVDGLGDVTIPVEVFIDGDGLLRRMEQRIDFDQILPALEDQGSAGAAAELEGATLDLTIEFFDFGAEVDVEAPEDAVDLTELFGGAFGGGIDVGGDIDGGGDANEISPVIPGN